MAGIIANSASATMADADTSADNTASGYMTRERIALSVTGSPDSVSWGLAKPTTSGSVCRLDGQYEAQASFAPDVEGYYVVTCIVNGATSYVLRLAVAHVASVSTLSAVRLIPVTNANVPAPLSGVTIFFSIDDNAVSKKLPDGSVEPL